MRSEPLTMLRSLRCHLALVVGILWSVLGCGGGGSPGTSVSFSLIPSSATVGANGQVRLVALRNGSPVDVTWEATSGTIVPLSTGNATFTAPSATTVVTVTAALVSSPGTTRTATINVQQGFATVTGRVTSGGSGGGVGNVPIEFRDGSDAVVATTTTFATGYFSAAVPPSAVRFHLQNAGFPTGFYKQYTYDTKRYSVLIATCSAPLPPIAADANTALATNVVLPPSFQPPPPPPDGCP